MRASSPTAPRSCTSSSPRTRRRTRCAPRCCPRSARSSSCTQPRRARPRQPRSPRAPSKCAPRSFASPSTRALSARCVVTSTSHAQRTTQTRCSRRERCVARARRRRGLTPTTSWAPRARASPSPNRTATSTKTRTKSGDGAYGRACASRPARPAASWCVRRRLRLGGGLRRCGCPRRECGRACPRLPAWRHSGRLPCSRRARPRKRRTTPRRVGGGPWHATPAAYAGVPSAWRQCCKARSRPRAPAI
mmetsp:Transcript_31182/g.72568  ORF Transcript_31182/g.72568 Transcript_31182/m.72568 type:complete len:248 (-) Transcript_31182:48-791(-)